MGGTFDVSIISSENRRFEVLATSGDTKFGGDDFDDVIVQYLLEEFKAKEGLDLSGDAGCLKRLIDASEKVKRDLSSLSVVSVNLPFIGVEENEDEENSGSVCQLDAQEFFESRCARLLERCKDYLLDAVEQSKLPDGMEPTPPLLLVGVRKVAR